MQQGTELRTRTGAHPAVISTVESLLLEERTRWAMQIHDGLTQSVTSALLEIQSLRHRIRRDPEEALIGLQEVEDAIREDIRQIRELLFQMQAPGDHSSEPALAAFVREQVARWKLPARIDVEGDVDEIPPQVLATVHGIVAEALANAAKHSRSADVSVRVRRHEDDVTVEVVDRGTGIAAVQDGDPHFGLRQMQSRAEDIGGTLEIESTPGHGTRIVAVLPVGGQGDRS